MLSGDPEHLTGNNIIHQANAAPVIDKDRDSVSICCPHTQYAKVFCAGKERLGKE